jgi:hypothetical protein
MFATPFRGDLSLNSSLHQHHFEKYGGPGQRYGDYSAFGQITGLYPCNLQAPSGTRLAGQPVLKGVIPIFIVGLSMKRDMGCISLQ